MRMSRSTGAFVACLPVAAALMLAGCRAADRPVGSPATTRAAGRKIVLTIVYDNNAYRKDLTPRWGFGCVVRGLDKTILFDTGGDGRVLLENMRRLNIDPKTIDVVALSHIHGDHTGGLAAFLKVRPGVSVYVPAGFPDAFKAEIGRMGGKVVEAPQSAEICRGARTTGTLGRGAIEEHALCVETKQGWLLITGCAHPGVENLAAAGKKAIGQPMVFVMGGFHMGGQPKATINAAIDRLETLGVKRVAPCHCTGDAARGLFKDRYGDNCSLVGVGGEFQFDPAR